jgi:hypothetical protein
MKTAGHIQIFDSELFIAAYWSVFNVLVWEIHDNRIIIAFGQKQGYQNSQMITESLFYFNYSVKDKGDSLEEEREQRMLPEILHKGYEGLHVVV